MLGWTPHDVLLFLPIGIFGLISWSIWLFRRTMSHRVEPVKNNFTTSTSLVVPIYREDPEVLSQCLDTWLAAGPDEILLVLDVHEDGCLEMLAGRELPASVRIITYPHTGKRASLGIGIRAATSEIVVVADSDTAWTPNLLREIQMPFAEIRVGGVGTRQEVAARDTSIWRRLASWLLDIRYLDYVPAMGSRGAVPCLSGRTAAYRRAVVTPLLPALENEVFLGARCFAGDDGRLTWLVLAAGYETVQQSSARAVSMFPDKLWTFLKQRVRWGRNSYRCYLTAMWNGWLWRQPFITQLTVMQILLTPLTMGVSLFYLWLGAKVLTAPFIGLVVMWVFIGRGIRGLSHLREHPRDIFILPVVVVMVMVIALPLKLISVLTMRRSGWMTRHAHTSGGEGQDNASLHEHGVIAPPEATL
jgi:hyaluronan synthase